MSTTPSVLSHLRQALGERLSESEIRSLCFDLAVDYDTLGGDSKTDKIRELLLYFLRRRKTYALIGAVRHLRPDISERELLPSEVSLDDIFLADSETPGSMTIANKKLGILYSEQRSILERIAIHQNNLQTLLTQKASYGIDVPLRIVNDINLQEHEIDKASKRLSEIDIEVSNISRPSLDAEGPQGMSKPVINANGVDYVVDVPFPLIRSIGEQLDDGSLQSTMHYAGGVVIKSRQMPGSELQISFSRHNRRVMPIIDEEHRSILLSPGHSIIVPGVALNTRRIETLDHITSDRIAEGRWTVLSPSHPKETFLISEWPQGFKEFVTTTQVTYEDGYELWMLQSPGDSRVQLWFYIGEWNVAPVIDVEKLALSFPKK